MSKVNDSNYLQEMFINDVKGYLNCGGEGGSAPKIEPITITENGTFTASDVDGYSPITVNVEASGGSDAEKYLEAQHKTVELPNVTAIKPYAFYKDTTLTSITMPKVERIGAYAFYQTNLTRTELPSGTTSIDEYAFASCVLLGYMKFPSGITSIGKQAFNSCVRLNTITFKGTPSLIASNAFNGCTNLTAINVPWAEGEVANAPWGATNATINYNYTGE